VVWESTDYKSIGYCRRVAHEKGFSDDPAVMRERLTFTQDGITRRRERVPKICFTDEVWAMRGAHTSSYVTIHEDRSDRCNPEYLRHKYSKVPAWMFHGVIVDGRKEPSCFWEKWWGTINSARYDEHILTHTLSNSSGTTHLMTTSSCKITLLPTDCTRRD
jgi:hypothetical protein